MWRPTEPPRPTRVRHWSAVAGLLGALLLVAVAANGLTVDGADDDGAVAAGHAAWGAGDRLPGLSALLLGSDTGHAAWGAGDRLPDLPAHLFPPGTDMSSQQLRAPFAAGEMWRVYSDENYPDDLYGVPRTHDRFDRSRLAFDLGVPGARSQEVLAVGSGYAIAACLTEHMAIVVLEIQSHGRFLHVHMDRSLLPSWLRTDRWTAVAQGQSLGRLWDNEYPEYVREVADDGCYQVTFGEHLHFETPVGAVIDGLALGAAAPNIGDHLASTNVRRARPTCEGRPATLVGSDADDALRGTTGADVIISLGGDDDVRGRRGNDLICAGMGDDQVAGGAGDDRILGEAGDDHLRGQSGNDELLGGTGSDRVTGGDGNDIVSGLNGTDVVAGNGGDDVVYGGWGNDTLYGGDGADTLYGWRGDDTINAGAGDDYVEGNWGTDTCDGGPGADVEQWCESTMRFP